MKRYYLVLILVPWLFGACGHKDKTSQETTQNTISAPAFNGDSAFAFVKAQTDFGPRTPNSEAHDRCAEFLWQKLNAYCDTVYVQQFTATAYDGKQLKSQNIIGSFSPEKEKRGTRIENMTSGEMANVVFDVLSRGGLI